MSTINETEKLVEEASDYKYGFTTNIEQELAPKGLNEDIVRFISKKKNEPSWLLEWRLKAFESLKKRDEELPSWANLKYDKINFQDIHYKTAKTSQHQAKTSQQTSPNALFTLPI